MSVARRKSLLNKDTSSAPQTAIEISEELREIVGDKINMYMLSVFLTDEKIIKVGSVQQKLGPLLRQRWLVLTDKPRLIILNGNIFEKKSTDESITPDMTRLARKRPSISMDPSKRMSGPVKDTISENSEQVITVSTPATPPIVIDQPAPVVISRRKSVLNYFSKDADVTPVPVVVVQDTPVTSAPLNRRKSVLQFINDKLKTSKSDAIETNILSPIPFNERRQSAIAFSEAEKKELKHPTADKPASQGDIISPLQSSQLKSSKSIKKPNNSTSSVSSTESTKQSLEIKVEDSRLEIKAEIKIDDTVEIQEIKEKNAMLITSGSAKYMLVDDKNLENWILAISMLRSLANPNVMFSEFLKM